MCLNVSIDDDETLVCESRGLYYGAPGESVDLRMRHRLSGTGDSVGV